MLYGILFKLQDEGVVCLVQGFQKPQSQDGARPFMNEYDCPLLELTRTIFFTSGEKHTSSSLSCPLNVVLAFALRKH